MRRILVAWGLAILAVAAVASSTGAHAAEEAKIHVQGVHASEPGKNAEIPASLGAYKGILKNLGFGKYTDGGSGDGSAAAGGSTTVKAAGYTLEITVVKIEEGQSTIKYVIKDAGGKEVGQNTVTLKSGGTSVAQVGDAAKPTFFILKLE